MVLQYHGITHSLTAEIVHEGSVKYMEVGADNVNDQDYDVEEVTKGHKLRLVVHAHPFILKLRVHLCLFV